MKLLKTFLLVVVIIQSSVVCMSQNKYEIPADKYDLFLNSFFSHCKKTQTELPYIIKYNFYSWSINMDREYLSLSLPFILDGDTSLYYYLTKPLYQYFMDTDSLVLLQGSYRRIFNFEAVGYFNYKDYMVVVYSFPLDDPNYYKCYTVNTYTKEGKRIDRLPFFMWRTDIDLIEWEDEFDPSWIEMTGYIDENFEITICQRAKWSEIHGKDGEGYDPEYPKWQEKMRKHKEYHVYRIDETGHFEEIKKDNSYVVDDNNNWEQCK